MIVSIAYFTFFSTATALTHLPGATLSHSNQSQISLHQYIATINNIPHHVLIVYSYSYCSGSLIKSRIVITAASCFEKHQRGMPIIVKVGSSMVTDLGQVIEVLEVKKHEYYGHHKNRNNDIAILILKEHVTFGSNVKKIMLAAPETDLRVGTSLSVSGWGSTTNLDVQFLNCLLWSKMLVMERNECKDVYYNLITQSNFCVKYLPERRLSDNGGPAIYNEELVGIVSFGAADTDEPYVAVLTNVSYFHKWILLNTDRFLNKYCAPPLHDEILQSEESQDNYAL